MTLGRRLAVSLVLVTTVAVLSPRPASAAIEVYPVPGVDTYKSDLYTVEVSSDGASWTPAYVYKFSRSSRAHWHPGTRPSVSFVTFGTDGPVSVRVARLAGAISSVDVSPHSRHIASSVAGGQAVETLHPNDKLWLTIIGDDANPLFLFADNPKPTVPPGATYFGPGVQDIAPASSNRYKASTDEAIYLDGGAWVGGNIDVHGTRVVLDSISIGGTPVTMANLATYFDVNPFVSALAVTGYPDYLASVLPVVGSAPGSHGSYFKTSMQAFNPDTTKNFPLRVVFHPAGAPASASDPSRQITILAGQVLYLPDLLPVMGVASGIGSLDMYYAVGETRKIATTFRVYNDGGAAGTSGFNEDLVPINKVFVSGATLLLTCPPDPAKARLNVGVRTLGDGATITATLRNAAGTIVKTVTNTYAANYFEQKTLDGFLGGATVVGNESLTLQITAGEAVVYGATIDNTTNDSSASLATRQ
jgi:hypothetical protein